MDLRFFALVHKYSLVLDSIKIEKVIFFSFFRGGDPLNLIYDQKSLYNDIKT